MRPSLRNALPFGALLLVLLVLPGPVAAHVLADAGGFGSGLAHPLTGLDHFLAMFAVGLWGAQVGGRSVWTLPATFPLVMAAAALAGMAGLPLGHVETGIALSILGLGLLIALRWTLPEALMLLVVGIFAVFHGYAHGVELPRSADPALYALGFVLATGAIHLVGIAVGLLVGRPFGGRLAQALGGVIALAGVGFLAAA